MSKDNAVQRTYLEIRDLIVRGALAPGSPLIEQRVADAVGASRTTVRSALQRLSNEGFVTSDQIGDRYSRFHVGPLTIDEMREWYFLFGALDGLAARGAALLPAKRRRALATRMRDLARAHLEAGSGDDPRYERIQRLDAEFHGTYVEAGAGPRLAAEYATLAPHVERYGIFYATGLIHRLPSEIAREHMAIADAVEAGTPDEAERAAVTNWRNATERFASVMRRWGEKGLWPSAGTGPRDAGVT